MTKMESFNENWKTFSMVGFVVFLTWLGIYFDMFDDSLWEVVASAGMLSIGGRSIASKFAKPKT